MKISKIALLALIAIVAMVGVLWNINLSATPKESTWKDVIAEAEKGGYKLITTDEFWKLYSENQDNLFVVDTRQEWEYRTGHIKDAVNFPMEPTWLSRWQQKGALEAILGANKNRSIVFY